MAEEGKTIRSAALRRLPPPRSRKWNQLTARPPFGEVSEWGSVGRSNFETSPSSSSPSPLSPPRPAWEEEEGGGTEKKEGGKKGERH